MNILGKIRERLKLYRLYAAGFMAFLPCLGVLSTGLWDRILLIKLFIIGLMGHGAGYILNEIVDIPMDSKSKSLRNKPLIKGTISLREAKAYVWLFGIIGVVITPFFFQRLYVVLFLYLSFCLGISYALFSKRIPGMEIIYGLWAVVFTLAGALSTGFWPTNLTKILILMMGIVMFFNVAVIGGLKDIVHDPKGGGRTTAWSMGVRVKKDRLSLPFSYITYLTGQLFILLFIVVLAPWYMLRFPAISQLIIYYFIVILIGLGLIRTICKFTRAAPSKRREVLGFIRNYVILSYLLVPTAFLLVISVETVLFITIFPLLWAVVSNIMVYGKIIPTI
ncbi:MAG: UbiA prenyltransferase family protein [Thermoplasmata archaeon]|nr:MAG: UbiA prenyltransferase family protein [Thermoplasmata archaeon]